MNREILMVSLNILIAVLISIIASYGFLRYIVFEGRATNIFFGIMIGLFAGACAGFIMAQMYSPPLDLFAVYRIFQVLTGILCGGIGGGYGGAQADKKNTSK